MINLDQLRRFSLYADLGDSELKQIAECTHRRSFAKDAYLFYPSSPVQNIYLLESGLLRIFYANENGEELLIDLLGPPSLAGMPLLYESQGRLVGMATLRPSVMLYIAQEDLRYYAERWPTLMRNIYLETDDESRKFLRRSLGISLLSMTGRLAARILYLFSFEMTTREQQEFEIPISQTEMANWLGASRGHLNRTLSHFQKMGLIHIDGQRWIVLDRPGLQRIAEEQNVL